ncbi:hypothetical protein JY651_36475 [Pyxidicoccus parkwayensis]|uniref:Lipoprotein n=1 Tax=Pyxidicoccus parkwayensis TaxID=2813578 RepID=A0ABX7NT81_9BACT|nr:hypothetical protein [Pyxidicoccus parkwaysis]QSQ20692.1 hypothetical protein JY651_36475 [Pyxidicoccus parkwaysis]
MRGFTKGTWGAFTVALRDAVYDAGHCAARVRAFTEARMRRAGWVVAMLWSGVLTAQAAEPEATDCDFRLECQVGAHEFSVAFDSESGECPEDDMSVFVETAAGKNQAPLAKRWYGVPSNFADGTAICWRAGTQRQNSGVTAFAVDDHRALLFFTEDDRPGYEWAGVVLIDAATGKVLDVKPRLGQSKESLVVVLKTPRGFKLQLIREYLTGVKCDCSAAFADDWMGVEVVNGKIRARWMR